MSGHKRMKFRAEHEGQLAANQSGQPEINVNDTERQFSVAGGAVLATCGLVRGSLSGLALAAIGGGLIYRGVTGHCHVYDAMRFSSAESGERNGNRGKQRDESGSKEQEHTDAY